MKGPKIDVKAKGITENERKLHAKPSGMEEIAFWCTVSFLWFLIFSRGVGWFRMGSQEAPYTHPGSL